MTTADAPAGPVVLAMPTEFDASTSVAVRRQISDTLDVSDVDTLVLDMSSTHFIDSTGLGSLVIARNLTNDRGIRLVLHDPQREVVSVLTRSGMLDLFAIEN